MGQDLYNVNHLERPPCHVSSVSRGTQERYQLWEDRVGKTLIEGVGNYLIILHPRLGNYVIVNKRSCVTSHNVPNIGDH